jgi:hypothetical protein
MQRVPQPGPWWPAVAAPVERGVRHPCALPARRAILHTNASASLGTLRQEQSRYPASAALAEGFAWRSAPCIRTHRFASSFPEAPSRHGWLTFCCPQRFSFFARAISYALRPATLSASISTLFNSDQSAAAHFRFWASRRCCTHGLRRVIPFDDATTPSGFAASWLFHPRRQAHFLLAQRHCIFRMPNVRAKRATTAGRQARAGENVQRTAGPGLVACRWRSA